MYSKYKYRNFIVLIVSLLVIMPAGEVWAAETTGEYLHYQEPQPSSTSWLANIAYVFSIIITFAVVIGLAYLTSRFLGQKMGQASANADHRVLATLMLGPNRAIQVVDVAGKVLVLGVTDHNITLLEEITDEARIAGLRQQTATQSTPTSFDSVFQRQLASLQQMSQKFPTVFNNRNHHNHDNESEKR
ncbi:MAG: flagellar biosynthetic protein FliO [Veillonellaceae bacterium]|jgi:flagellar protein FliO/FliZ|nr:flagellar biosynthetic protein FliO [Veillonellaceae bacterium]